jgi:RNA polymerase primary sigma factor
MTAIKEKKTKTAKYNAGDDVLGMYLKEVSRIPLLSREEEYEAAKAAAQGDIYARNKLINSNLRFVLSVAKKYQGFGVPLSDLVNEGNVGLIQAADKFDVDRGYRFISYAVWWIRQSILKALYEKSRFIRLPVNQTNDLIHIKRARRKLIGHCRAEDQVQEIAQMLNIKEGYIEDIMAISREVVSLEKLADTEKGAFSLEELIVDDRYDAPEQEVLKKSLEDDIEGLLDTLDSKEAEIIRLHYGLGKRVPMSFQEIGDRFHLTKERIRQIEAKALTRLQHVSRKSRLAAYMAS